MLCKCNFFSNDAVILFSFILYHTLSDKHMLYLTDHEIEIKADSDVIIFAECTERSLI